MENTSGQGKAAVVPEGVKGLAWAWRNKHWDSVEHFNKVQRLWLKAGLIVLCVSLLLGIVAAIVIPMMANDAEQVSVSPPVMPQTITQLSAPAATVVALSQSVASGTVSAAIPAASLMSPEEFKAGFEKDSVLESRNRDFTRTVPKTGGTSADSGSGKADIRADKDARMTVAEKRLPSAKLFSASGRRRVAAPEKPTKPGVVLTTEFNDVMTAVIYQDMEAVTQLLDLGWWVDRPDLTGYTPLMEAVVMGDAPMVELLLLRGANQNAAVRGDSSLKIARRNRDVKIETLLLRYGATDY